MSMTMMEWYNDRITVKKVILYKGETLLQTALTVSPRLQRRTHPPNATQPPLSFYSDTDYDEILIIVIMTFFLYEPINMTSFGIFR